MMIRRVDPYSFEGSLAKFGNAFVTPSLSRLYGTGPVKVSIKSDNVEKGLWAVKENFAEYVEQRIPNLTNYMDLLERTPAEEASLLKLKTAFAMSTKQPDFFPFSNNTDETTKTFENSGKGFLSQREIQSFNEEGIIGPIALKALPQETIDSVRKQYTGVTGTLGAKGYRDVRVRQEWVSPHILDLACSKEIVTRISSLLGENIKVRFTGIHEVAPGTGGFSAATDDKIASLCAHSDMNLGARLSKIGLKGSLVDTDSINVWISITDIHERNAPLFVFPKTHKWPILTPSVYLHHAKSAPQELERTFRYLTTAEFGSEIVANHALFYNYLQTCYFKHELPRIFRTELYMQPANYLIFSTHLQHGSDINQTDVPRLGISVRYSRATNKENGDTTRLVNSIFSTSERLRLGLKENETRAPILQVLGSNRHKDSIPINQIELRKIIIEKAGG